MILMPGEENTILFDFLVSLNTFDRFGQEKKTLEEDLHVLEGRFLAYQCLLYINSRKIEEMSWMACTVGGITHT